MGSNKPQGFNIARLIGPGSNLEEIQALLAQAEEEKQNEEKEDKEEIGVEETDTLEVLREKVNELTDQFEQLSEYVTMMQNTLDRSSLPILFRMITDGVKDYRTAYDCTTFYTLGWFSRSFLSEEGKISFAEHLINTVSPLNTDNLESWELIVNRDPDTMDYISFPRK